MKKYRKLGHQVSGKYVSNYDFNEIQLKVYGEEYDKYQLSDSTYKFAFFDKESLIYNERVEDRNLHYGLPSIYTDNRFTLPFIGNTLYYKRFTKTSLKKLKRLANKVYNLPEKGVFEFRKGYYYTKIKTSNFYYYKPKRKHKEYSFEVNKDSYIKLPPKDLISNWSYYTLIEKLRNEGFLVKVNEENENRLFSMLRTAQVVTGNEPKELNEEEKTFSFVAYGYGKRVGFSVNNDTLFGYGSGTTNVLWDWWDEFDKWSRCNEIPKTTPIDEIINILKQDRPEGYEEEI